MTLHWSISLRTESLSLLFTANNHKWLNASARSDFSRICFITSNVFSHEALSKIKKRHSNSGLFANTSWAICRCWIPIFTAFADEFSAYTVKQYLASSSSRLVMGYTQSEHKQVQAKPSKGATPGNDMIGTFGLRAVPFAAVDRQSPPMPHFPPFPLQSRVQRAECFSDSR